MLHRERYLPLRARTAPSGCRFATSTPGSRASNASRPAVPRTSTTISSSAPPPTTAVPGPSAKPYPASCSSLMAAASSATRPASLSTARAAAATRCACAVSGPACRSIPSTGARTGIPTTTTSSPRLTTDPKRCSGTSRDRTSTPITHSILTSARPTAPISGSRSASRPTARRICHWSRTPVRPRAPTPAAAWSSCGATPRRASGKRPTSSIWGRSAPHAGCSSRRWPCARWPPAHYRPRQQHRDDPGPQVVQRLRRRRPQHLAPARAALRRRLTFLLPVQPASIHPLGAQRHALLDGQHHPGASRRQQPSVSALHRRNRRGSPGVRRDSLLLVDDRGPDEPAELQISNFNVLEDRETLDIEICLTASARSRTTSGKGRLPLHILPAGLTARRHQIEPAFRVRNRVRPLDFEVTAEHRLEFALGVPGKRMIPASPADARPWDRRAGRTR